MVRETQYVLAAYPDQEGALNAPNTETWRLAKLA